MYQFWQVVLNKNSALETPGQKDRDVDNRVKFDLYIYPQNIFSPLIIKSSLSLLHVSPAEFMTPFKPSSNAPYPSEESYMGQWMKSTNSEMEYLFKNRGHHQ